MSNNSQYQKGSTNTAVVALIILLIFLLLGGAVYYIYRTKPLSYELGTTTTSTTTTVVETGTTGQTQTVTTVINPFPGGPIYRNANYGLTVPLPANYQGYSVTLGNDAFAGVSDLASIHFNNGGVTTFTVNVFTKEQWNNIRIQETNGQINSYGEGNYLGENKNYIFSTTALNQSSVQPIFDNIQFY